MALAEAKIDIFHQLYKMRQQRVNMIENVDQYQMVHFILLLILQCVSVPSHNGILCNNTTMNFEVENIIATRVEKQLKFLDDSAWQDEAMKCINLDCKRPNINAKRKLKHQTGTIPFRLAKIIPTYLFSRICRRFFKRFVLPVPIR